MSASSPQADPKRGAATIFIFITVLLDMLALGMIIPVLPELIKEFRGGDIARAAQTVGWFGTSWAAIQFFAAPVLGSLSDRFGRRRVILLSNFGLGLDYILMAVAPSLGWLFVGRLISGVTSASVPTAFAYIADVTAPERRAKAYGLMGAAFGGGFILGPAIGGMLSQFGPRAPFWVAAGFSLANALYGVFVLPESLAPEHRRAFSWARANPAGSFAFLRAQGQLLGFASVHLLYNLAHQSLQSMFVLYADYRYGWSSNQVGYALALVGICFAVIQSLLVGRVVKRFGARRSMLAGLGLGAAGFTIYGFAPTGTWFLIGIPIMALWGFYGPAAMGLMTERVSRSEQGMLQGALAGVAGITGIIGPRMFAETFALFIGPSRPWHMPGAPYLLAALLLVAAFAIAWRVARPRAPLVGA